MDAASLFIPDGWTSAFPQPLSTVELLERWDYPAETWQVETADGHILVLHRVPAQGKPAVLLLHGLFCSSAEWLLAGPDRSLGKPPTPRSRVRIPTREAPFPFLHRKGSPAALRRGLRRVARQLQG
ncbi:lipase 3-like [Thrips palmi]|uniref:Lipase 3-like n=1 Tax=Thrips palmi TaxID=161013 RepID=A0A6P9A667_THRPL|nr:lipase 3-like [Thrips palmi]